MEFLISNAEKEVLEVLWHNKRWMSCSELVDHFNHNGKSWKRQTVNTFLTRLMEKGFVIKNGSKYIYSYTQEEFESKKANELVETLYDGSLKKFISALTGKTKIDKKYANELREYLESQSEDE